MSRKKSPQNAILKILGKKKVISVKNLKHEAELDVVEAKFGYAVSRAIKNLISGGLAEKIDSDQSEYLRLTSQGRKKLASAEISDGTLPVPATWDGKWRIIILDIPEDRKNEREALRYLLKKAGFALLKNSAWISPYPFENLFINIKKDLNLTSEIMIIVTDTIDEETKKIINQMFGK